MTRSMLNRITNAQIALIKMSAPKLVDNLRKPLTPPVMVPRTA